MALLCVHEKVETKRKQPSRFLSSFTRFWGKCWSLKFLSSISCHFFPFPRNLINIWLMSWQDHNLNPHQTKNPTENFISQKTTVEVPKFLHKVLRKVLILKFSILNILPLFPNPENSVYPLVHPSLRRNLVLVQPPKTTTTRNEAPRTISVFALSGMTVGGSCET